jgi:hypothetical protein
MGSWLFKGFSILVKVKQWLRLWECFGAALYILDSRGLPVCMYIAETIGDWFCMYM